MASTNKAAIKARDLGLLVVRFGVEFVLLNFAFDTLNVGNGRRDGVT